MAKAKKKSKPKRAKHYNDKLAVNGSFMDIVKASVKHADANSKKNEKK